MRFTIAKMEGCGFDDRCLLHSCSGFYGALSSFADTEERYRCKQLAVYAKPVLGRILKALPRSSRISLVCIGRAIGPPLIGRSWVSEASPIFPAADPGNRFLAMTVELNKSSSKAFS